jgi:hypothetical protein
MEMSGQLHTLANLFLVRELQKPIGKWLDGLQSKSGHCGEAKKSLASTRNRILAIQPIAHHYTN